MRVEYSQARGQYWRTTVGARLSRAGAIFRQYRRNSHISAALRTAGGGLGEARYGDVLKRRARGAAEKLWKGSIR
jgi:hypothetical protein